MIIAENSEQSDRLTFKIAEMQYPSYSYRMRAGHLKIEPSFLKKEITNIYSILGLCQPNVKRFTQKRA